MSKSIPTTTTVPSRAWPQRVRACWPLLPLTTMGMITLVALSHPSTRADGPAWTLPYQGTYTNNGVNSGIDVFINNTGTGTAIQGNCLNGTGVIGLSSAGSGLYGVSANGYGVQGVSSNYIGLLGNSGNIGVLGNTSGNGYGVVGQGNASGVGVLGNTQSAGRAAVEGYNTSGFGRGGVGIYGSGDTGIVAAGSGYGLIATSTNATGASISGFFTGVSAVSTVNLKNNGVGVYGEGHQYGVHGVNTQDFNGAAVFGESHSATLGVGVRGSAGATGVVGVGNFAGSTGVSGSGNSIGVYGSATSGASGNYGVYGDTNAPDGNYAGYFVGNVKVTGTLTAATKNFTIDHPLDPANKYLVHACVESNEMMNIYRGNVTLDSDGRAVVQMPDWFQAENGDFSYQLTCIGGFAPVYVDKELQDNRFEVAGGKAGQKISWQVTGIRQDAYARAHPIQVEEAKTSKEKGKYLNPLALGKSETLGIDYETRQRTMQTLHDTPAIKAPTLPALPKTYAMPAPFKPIRVPVSLGLLNTPKSPDVKP